MYNVLEFDLLCMYVYMYVCLSVCMCVCVCVCVCDMLSFHVGTWRAWVASGEIVVSRPDKL